MRHWFFEWRKQFSEEELTQLLSVLGIKYSSEITDEDLTKVFEYYKRK